MKFKKTFALLLCATLLCPPAFAEDLAEDALAEEVRAEIVKIEEETPGTLPAKVYARVTTEKGALNMRKSARSNAPRVTAIPNHSTVLVLEQNGDWSSVAYNQKTGFVQTAFLTVLESLPLTALEMGDKGQNVYDIKDRLYKLKYITSTKAITTVFDNALIEALNVFCIVNGLEPTDALTPELQAFILWGDAKKNDGSANGVTIDALSGLTVKLTYKRHSFDLIEESTKIKNYYTYSADIKGGTPPYTSVVTVKKGNEKTTIYAPNFSFICDNDGGEISAFQLIITVTDADGNTVTASTWPPYTRSAEPPYEYEYIPDPMDSPTPTPTPDPTQAPEPTATVQTNG